MDPSEQEDGFKSSGYTWRDSEGDQVEEGSENDNIWIAAGDGNIDRVLTIVHEDPGLVNAQDENGYSPL